MGPALFYRHRNSGSKHGEGQSFISAIETRRKAIETSDLLERIKKLEEASGK